MNKKICDILDNKRAFSLVVSLIITFFVFLAVWGQAVFSDVVTFGTSGDQMQLCFSSFQKLGRNLQNGIISGVDYGTSNGATEFYLRGQIPVKYLPIMIMAFLGNYIGFDLAYLLFYIFHFFVAVYFAQRVGMRFFGLTRGASVIFASSCVPLFCYEMWYSSHAIVTFLVIPLFYFLLNCKDGVSKIKWLLLPMPVVLAFTAGYITLALSLVVVTWGMSIAYVVLVDDNKSKKNMIRNVTLPVVTGGVLSFLYYLSVFVYIKNVVKAGAYSLADAIDLKLNVKNFAHIAFYSFISIDAIEQLPIITMGVIWILCLICVGVQKEKIDYSKSKSVFLKISIAINVFLLLVSCGGATPLGVWFYSLFPIVGQTHLPIRYMMLTIPFLYLSLSVLYNRIGDEDYKNIKVFYILFWVTLSIIMCICLITAGKPTTVFDDEKLILELIVLSFVFLFIYKYGWKSWRVILLWSIYMIFIGVDIFHSIGGVTKHKGDVQISSVIYDDYNLNTLADYIAQYDGKELIRFAHLDSTRSVTVYVPGNFEWFSPYDNHLTNYIGMDVHTCLPEDYREKFSWFDRLDWDYLLNTRADFVIADQGSIDKNPIMETVTDWGNSSEYLNNIYRICSLKKYIPTYYTGGVEFVEDTSDDVLDNGIFYCPYLKNDDIVNFTTDGATSFELELTSNNCVDVAFLLYPCRCYKYFVDGNEVSPILYDSQAFISVPDGKHTVSILYKNKLDYLSNVTLWGYYVVFLFNIVFLLVFNKRKFASEV